MLFRSHFMRKGSRSAVPSNVFSNTSRETRTTTAVVIKNVPPIRKISFIRTSEKVREISKAQDHEKEFCTRCKKAEELMGDCELCSVRNCMNDLIVNVALEALYIYTKKVEVMG